MELHRKGSKSRTVSDNSGIVRVAANLSVLIKVRRVHYGEMGKAPTTLSQSVHIYLSIYLSMSKKLLL